MKRKTISRLLLCLLFVGIVTMSVMSGITATAATSPATITAQYLNKENFPDLSALKQESTSVWSDLKALGINVANVGNHTDADPNVQVFKSGNSDGDYGIRPHEKGGVNYDANIGTQEYSGGLNFTFKLSTAMQEKANKGRLGVNASADYWHQDSMTHYTSVRIQFLDKSGSVIEFYPSRTTTYTEAKTSVAKTTAKWGISYGDFYTHLSKEEKVPQGTYYIRVWWSNSGNGNDRSAIAGMSVILKEGQVSTDSIEIVDQKVGYVAGDTIKFRVNTFNLLNADNSDWGTAYIDIGGTKYESTSAKYTTGALYLTYDFKIPSGIANGKEIKFVGISNFCYYSDSYYYVLRSGDEIFDTTAISPTAHTHAHQWLLVTGDDTHHWSECTSYCPITENEDKRNYGEHLPSEDDRDCTTAQKCVECNKILEKAKPITSNFDQNNLYIGTVSEEIGGKGGESEAIVFFAQLRSTQWAVENYGIIIENNETGEKKFFEAKRIGSDGKFGIAIYNFVSSDYTAVLVFNYEGVRYEAGSFRVVSNA